MKKIVCELCESTDFIKEDGLFVCQGCSCKYPIEDIKRMMKEFDDEPQQSTAPVNTEPKDENLEKEIEKGIAEVEEVADIPRHTPDSPNKLAISVVKVGHETYTTASVASLSVLLGGEFKPVFMEGPDEVGHIGAEISLQNIAGKTIKYVTVYLAPFNAVGDQVGCTVEGHSVFGIEVTGPIAAGEKWEGYSDGMWYNGSIVSARIHHVHVIYMDGTEEMYDGEEFYGASTGYVEPKTGEKMATITVKRNQFALTNKITKLNRLECTLSTGEKFELGFGQSVSIPVKHGRYKIDFDYWGSSISPAKVKSTPEFDVYGDVYIELSPDNVWGGFKSKIINQ